MIRVFGYAVAILGGFKREPTMDEWMFIGEYVIDWDGAKALRRTGYVGKYACQTAYDILRRPCVKAEVEKVRDSIKEKVGLTIEMVVEDIKKSLMADPRDLVAISVGACRYCHGLDHLYQYTPAEWATAAAKGVTDTAGGVGYRKTASPHPECPECDGEGLEYVKIADLRNMSPEAAALYMGAKQGKHGIEIQMRSKDAAREAAARFLGMNKQTIDVMMGKKAKDLGDDDLAAIAAGG